MNVDVGGYQVGDVEISAAFDISANKVGRDVSEAIFAQPNNTFRFASVPPSGVYVCRGPTLDGIGRYLREDIVESETGEADVADVLLRSGTDVVVSYLPTGSQCATEFYAERAIEAGCGFINCIPVFVASNQDRAMELDLTDLILVWGRGSRGSVRALPRTPGAAGECFFV